MPCVAAGLCRLRLDRWQRDEVAQMVRERLLVGSGSQPPRIALYNGRGDLAGWVRVVAVHTGLNHVRDTRRETAVGEQALIAASTQPATDVELSRLKQLYRTEFSEAFCHALASLTTRQRNLLRQHFLDGVTLDRLAVLYRVHRATAARWLAAARAELLARTQQDLMRRLRIEETEVRSIIRLVHSQLEVSLHQFLARPSVETP
jgi:RNA polymerase sigma-70 factor (ECF subfamily)